ncbi:hypothetical protein F441_12377 [Phytophthora nicotianae CJ01A1]|uniref:THH1/TOM1/TOM3 domain-containing protein n=4 Tax=Phytophthora nicotianae TaxID=4792 RepID=W2WNZ2_PHYNI|nr:hypothetical protein L915_12113 [Phytophthora nicotianae]ETO71127.1 hypothetical protein F444_12491 [Phytophthora nicotianae P1976]ETP12221.1 hypothetical protein F441_12377 [Phytophthora nicotianae CJ01A1]
MGFNITDATCDYGLAQTEWGCLRTLASYDTSAYMHFQIGYCVVGSASLIMSATMYYRADKYDGSPLQLHSFLLCCYASLTVIVRGADPDSYGHIIPRPIGAFLSDSCTATLYSVYVLALGYWATIIQQGAAVIRKPAHLKCMEYSTIAFIWAFYLAYDMSRFAFKGFIPLTLNYVQLGVSASVLAVIALTFLIYGLRVMARLQEYERQLKITLDADYMMSNHSFELNLSDSEDSLPVEQECRFAPRRPQEGHTTKIKKILLVAEMASIAVIAGQMYMITQVSNSPIELSCANGMLCSKVKSKWNLLHIFQVVCVWVILYVFRDVQKKNVIPHPRGSAGY